jgi:hypothetical protein
MKLSNLMAIKAVIVVFFGVCYILIPVPLLSFFGLTMNQGGTAIAQLFGASFILLGILLWLAKNAPGSEVTLRALVLAVFIGDAIGFLVALMGQLSGTFSSLGWIVVALYFLLALGFGYFQFVKPAAS